METVVGKKRIVVEKGIRVENKCAIFILYKLFFVPQKGSLIFNKVKFINLLIIFLSSFWPILFLIP